MGITYAEIAIENPYSRRRLDTKALVDSGSIFFTLPAHLAVQLGFDPTEVSTREVILADDSRKPVPMIGPFRVPFFLTTPYDHIRFRIWISHMRRTVKRPNRFSCNIV